ncbi:hypothetical protein BN1263210056 [Stenotrophomonas maltophilia]|nr:hypothetical protein BN1263210056 [Stenotrophomonas maltophilia]
MVGAELAPHGPTAPDGIPSHPSAPPSAHPLHIPVKQPSGASPRGRSR